MAKTKHLNFTEEMLNKHYKGKFSVKDMANYFGVHEVTVYNRMKDYGIVPRGSVWTLIKLPKKLAKNLMNKYASLTDRCDKKRRSNNYYDLDYLNAKEYADFCNQNKGKLLKMWGIYTQNDKELKYAISIDRVDTNEGYTKDNIQFIPYGFNSWKDETTPLKLTFENKIVYCLSKEGGSRKLGFKREKIVGEAERNENDLNIKIKYLDNKEKVLKRNNCKSLFEYYKKYIE